MVKNNMDKKLTMLMILDVFGENKNEKGNAVKLAKTPNIDKLMKTCPTTDIYTSGLSVGLPEGQMGNSEVGHTNIGAGRIVYQELTILTIEFIGVRILTTIRMNSNLQMKQVKVIKKKRRIQFYRCL